MIKRIALLAILALAPLAAVSLWPKLLERFTIAELNVALVRQPREEVLISGFIKSFGAQPFSIQTLMIEEPGKEPYRRLVSVDAENNFELTLGKPVTGTYRASLLLGKAQSGVSIPEKWLTTRHLTVNAGGTSPAQQLTARESDRPRLFAVAGVCATVWIVLLGFCGWSWSQSARQLRTSQEQTSRG